MNYVVGRKLLSNLIIHLSDSETAFVGCLLQLFCIYSPLGAMRIQQARLIHFLNGDFVT